MRLQLLRAATLPLSGPVCSLPRHSSPPTPVTLPSAPFARLSSSAPAAYPAPAPPLRRLPSGGSFPRSTHRSGGSFLRSFRSGSARMAAAAEGEAAAGGLVAGHTEESCIFCKVCISNPRTLVAGHTEESCIFCKHKVYGDFNIARTESCIFCKIRDGVIPSTRIMETEHAFAILDAFPMTRGHTLLIPKKHYAFLEDMPAEEAAAVMQELPKLARAVRMATGAKGINVAQNNGTVAGQVVFHVHIHILPRVDGDGLLKLGKSGGMIEASEAAAVKDAIAAALSYSSL